MDWMQIRIVFLLSTLPAAMMAINYLAKPADPDDKHWWTVLVGVYLTVWVAVAAVQLHYFLKGLA